MKQEIAYICRNLYAMGTIIEIRKTGGRIQLDEALKRVTARMRRPNLRKFLGKVRFADADPVDYQKKMRDEW